MAIKQLTVFVPNRKGEIVSVTDILAKKGINLNPRLHSDEILIALASSANADEKAARAMDVLSQLKGCQAHCSVMLSQNDFDTYKRLGIQLTCEPQYQTNKLYHK